MEPCQNAFQEEVEEMSAEGSLGFPWVLIGSNWIKFVQMDQIGPNQIKLVQIESNRIKLDQMD